jgi:hypothetical protein
MTDIDDRIRSALDEDDRAFLASLDSRGLFSQIGDTLGGPLAGWARLVAGIAVVLALLALFAVWKLVTAQSSRELVLWATAVIVVVIAQGFTKDWLFSRMNMFAILREVKRLQLQVAMLQERREP